MKYDRRLEMIGQIERADDLQLIEVPLHGGFGNREPPLVEGAPEQDGCGAKRLRRHRWRRSSGQRIGRNAGNAQGRQDLQHVPAAHGVKAWRDLIHRSSWQNFAARLGVKPMESSWRRSVRDEIASVSRDSREDYTP
jgi:hypothetical protein